MRGPCAEPVPRRHSRRREKSARTALARRKLNGGWPTAWARDVADENLELAGRLPAGTVIERRLEAFCVRAVVMDG
jgi:hypothetical protein